MIDFKRVILAVLGTVFAVVSCSGPRPDWGAVWIGAPWDGEVFDQDNAGPAPIFKKTFKVNEGLDSAKIKICGLGLFELRVNGTKVSDDVLVPNESLYSYRSGFTDDPLIPINGENFSNYRVYYLEYDLRPYLKEGDNEMTVLLGNGFFSSDSRRFVKSYGTPRMICRADLFYSGGEKKAIVSDLSWRVSKSPLVMNDIFNGEIYDARLEGKEVWHKPAVRKAPDGKLELQTAPSDRVMEVLEPKSIVKLDNGEWEVDFGDYVTGWVRFLNIHSVPRGFTVEVVYPSAEYGNGVQKYIARGEQAAETYAPRFTWYTFRTVRIKGIEQTLKPSQLCAEVVYSNVRTTGDFECSNPLINRVQHLFWRAQSDNMHMGVPTDCPHRERGPYTGDGQVACITAMHTFDMNLFYRKWIRDMADCQDKETGYVPNGAPWHRGCGGGVPWGAAMNIVPWEHYLHYGDISVLEENYVPMKAQLKHMLSWRREDGTMLQHFVDKDGKSLKWLNLGEWSPVAELPDDALVHTYYLWKCALNTAKAAKALGYEDDYNQYSSLTKDVYDAFHRAFYNPETRSYGHNDGANIFALAMGVPEEYKGEVISSLKKEIVSNDGHLFTGIFGTQLFFEVLCQNGLSEWAYNAMTKIDIPSYGYWVVQGADTLWEYWDGRHSRNHPMFGGGLVWLYRVIAGVNVDEEEPGYKHVVIKPTPVGDLRWARYSTDTPYGHLAVRWEKKTGRKLSVKVDIPDGSHASVYLPETEDPIEIEAGHYEF